MLSSCTEQEYRALVMGITGIIALVLLALLIVTISVVISGIREKDWKKIVFPIIAFAVLSVGI